MAYEVIQADSANVVLNSPNTGETRIAFSTLTYIVGTGELLAFYNGAALIPGIDYTEEDPSHIILNFLPDATPPDVDTFSMYTIEQGSSLYIPSPTIFNQVNPPKRPDNFGGKFIYP